MNTIELFSGTKSFSKVAEELGHDTFTIDNDYSLNPDWYMNVLEINSLLILIDKIDIIWASPPCTAFSVASIGRHWEGGKCAYIPKSDTARLGLRLLEHTIKLIAESKPTLWYIENPRGVMRKVIDEIFIRYGITNYRRVTITYCQYGDTRMKPTDIWTNDFDWQPRPMCKNGDKCHISAPRGSKTGTQGLKNAKDRGVIPPAVFYEIFRGK